MEPAGGKVEGRKAREEAVDWALRIEDGALSEEQARDFETWRKASPANEKAFRDAERLLMMSSRVLADKPEETLKALSATGGASAKLLVMLAVVLGLGFWAADGPVRLSADVVTGANDTRIVQLEDGSRIRLNGRSALSERFGPKQREVTLLRGEAYFEIAKDAARPFVVKAGEGRIRVLGTAFNVNMTAGETEVTVTENTVQLSAAEERSVTLTSGERTSYDSAGSLGAVEEVSPELAVPWLSGRLVFENQPLGQVVEQFARRMPGRFVVIGDELRKRRISGSFDMTDADSALTGFTSAFGLRTVRIGPLATAIY